MDASITQNTEHVLPKAMIALEEINKALDDLAPLASQIDELKAGLLDKESAILAVVFQKISPLIGLFSIEYEHYYRRSITILIKEERIKHDETACFYSEHQLILYEGNRLIDQHIYGDECTGSRIGWQMIKETELTPVAAIMAFGLDAIMDGLLQILKKTTDVYILNAGLKERITTLMDMLERLQ